MENRKNEVTLKSERNRASFRYEKDRILSPTMYIDFHFNFGRKIKKNRYFLWSILTGVVVGIGIKAVEKFLTKK